jgi:hypothetical protein
VEPFLQEAVAIGVQEVLEEEDEAEEARNKENSADEVGHFVGRSFSHKIQDKDEDHLEDGEQEPGLPEGAKKGVLLVEGGDADLADPGNPGDQIGFEPAEEELGQDEDMQATVWA